MINKNGVEVGSVLYVVCCDRKLSLDDPLTNECKCCGQEYNFAGQRLTRSRSESKEFDFY
jgi:hypothetical protein